MRKPLVGGVSLSTEGDDLGGTVAAQGRHVSVPYPHLPPVSYALSPRRRRTLGAPARRIWPGCHCADWHLAVPGGSQWPRDASALPDPRSGVFETMSHQFDVPI